MIATIADQWLAQNAGRKYPIADDVDTGIPDNAILDLRCTVRSRRLTGVPVADIVEIADDTEGSTPCKVIRVAISSGDTGEELDDLLFSVPENIADGLPYTAYAESEHAYGVMTVSSAVLTLPEAGRGEISVRMANTTVAADCLGVDSIQALNGSVGTVISRSVRLDQGYNADPYIDGNRIRVDITKGGGIGENWQTQPGTQTCNNVLFTINGERPGSDGDIKITGGSGILVTPIPDEHAIEITVAKTAMNIIDKDCKTAC